MQARGRSQLQQADAQKPFPPSCPNQHDVTALRQFSGRRPITFALRRNMFIPSSDRSDAKPSLGPQSKAGSRPRFSWSIGRRKKSRGSSASTVRLDTSTWRTELTCSNLRVQSALVRQRHRRFKQFRRRLFILSRIGGTDETCSWERHSHICYFQQYRAGGIFHCFV